MESAPRPITVAAVRGIVEAVVIGALAALAVALTDLDFGAWNVLLPVAQTGIRTIEGYADEKIDPTKPRSKLGRKLAGTSTAR